MPAAAPASARSASRSIAREPSTKIATDIRAVASAAVLRCTSRVSLPRSSLDVCF
jgi:hypothetical protein